MKVLIVANYAKEHINAFHLSTIKKFKEMGWQVDVACKADAEVPGADNVFNLPLERNPYRLQTIKAIKQLKKIISNGNYDVVHCHTYAGKLVGILSAKKFRKNGLKVVYSAHGFQYYKGSGIVSWLVFMPIDKWLIKNVDLLITSNNEDYKTAHKHHFKAKHIEKCCGVGIKPERFGTEGKTKNETRKSIGVDEDAVLLIYVAELNKNKNQIMLINAFEQLKNKIPKLNMIFAGVDHYDGKIQNIISERKLDEEIKYLGWRADIPDLIKASDIAVASSHREGFGLNIVEYQVCGVPVVAADNRGHREIIENGVSGFLVPKDDYKTMAKKVLELYENPELKKKIAINAKEKSKEFEDESIVEMLVGFYKKYILEEA